MTGTTTKRSASLHPAILQPLYHIRYILARPLQLRLVPSIIPVIPLPYLKSIPYITVGQVLLMIPWLLLFVTGYDKTFHTPDLGGSGEITSYAIIVAFLTANKANSVFAFFFGISFERMVPIHNLYACLCAILAVFHGYVAYKYGDARRRLTSDNSAFMESEGSDSGRRLDSEDSEYGLNGNDPDLWKFMWDGGNNFSGTMCTICLVGLVVFSFFRTIRQYLFEVWLYSHIIFAIGVIVFGVMHSVPILLVPLVWWVLDATLRYGLEAFGRFPTSATLTRLGDDLVEVRFLRSFAFQPGQFVQISIPAVGVLQFHPVTISSAPYEKYATLHIRALGGWSTALVELAGHTQETSILVEGPYGNLSFGVADDRTYPVVLCISGGIGVTPCQSVARHLIHEAELSRQLEHFRFTWVVRDTNLLDALPTVATDGRSYLADHETGEESEASPSKSSRFYPEVYVTRAQDEDLVGRNNVTKGRPDIQRIIQETIAVAKSKGASRVAVVTCGPERMVDEVKAECRKSTNICGPIALDVHDEIFNF